MSLKDLLQNVKRWAIHRKKFLPRSANRLIRLDKQINEREKATFTQHANGQSIHHVVKKLLNAYDPDTVEDQKEKVKSQNPDASPDTIEKDAKQLHQQILRMLLLFS